MSPSGFINLKIIRRHRISMEKIALLLAAIPFIFRNYGMDLSGRKMNALAKAEEIKGGVKWQEKY
jgi:hypothetical protein